MASKTWRDRAHQVTPGGALGFFFMPPEHDVVMERGAGAFMYDTQGKQYLDLALGSGPLILGHAHPEVVEAIKRQAEQGTTFYAINTRAIEMAEKLVDAIPCAEMVKYAGSGSEATFYAMRIARAATGRTKILKFEGAFHGTHDYSMMSWAPSKPAEYPRAFPDSAGTPKAIEDSVLVVPFNDLAAAESVMRAHAADLAAVIVEPMNRLIEAVPGFLEGLRKLTKELGSVLIFDEVVTGFRNAWGGAQEICGVIPDMACYGKIIGGGLPLAAVVGNKDLLGLANPRQRGAPSHALVSGTLNGNPLSCAAGLATLGVLERPGTYERLGRAGDTLRAGLRASIARHQLDAQVLGSGCISNIYFTTEEIRDYRTNILSSPKLVQQLRIELLDRGLIANLGAMLYLSVVHTESDVQRAIDIFDASLEQISLRMRAAEVA